MFCDIGQFNVSLQSIYATRVGTFVVSEQLCSKIQVSECLSDSL